MQEGERDSWKIGEAAWVGAAFSKETKERNIDIGTKMSIF